MLLYLDSIVRWHQQWIDVFKSIKFWLINFLEKWSRRKVKKGFTKNVKLGKKKLINKNETWSLLGGIHKVRRQLGGQLKTYKCVQGEGGPQNSNFTAYVLYGCPLSLFSVINLQSWCQPTKISNFNKTKFLYTREDNYCL